MRQLTLKNLQKINFCDLYNKIQFDKIINDIFI